MTGVLLMDDRPFTRTAMMSNPCVCRLPTSAPGAAPRAPRISATLLPVALTLLLAACNLAPPYDRSDTLAAVLQGDLKGEGTVYAGADGLHGLRTESASEQSRAEAATLHWVLDPALRETIALALTHNRDLRAAIAGMERARAQYGITQAAQWPTIAAQAQHTRSGAGGTAGARYSAQLGLTGFEIDLWGRVRNLNTAALHQFLQVQHNQRSVRTALVADVTAAWLTLAANQQRLALAQATLRTRETSAYLAQAMFRAGSASGLNVVQTLAQRDAAQGEVALYEGQLQRSRNALLTLLGTPLTETLLPCPPVWSQVSPSLAPSLETQATFPDAQSATDGPTAPPAVLSTPDAAHPGQGDSPAPSDRFTCPTAAQGAQATLGGASFQLAPNPHMPTAVADSDGPMALAATLADIPSSALLSRPDVLAAEHLLQAAHASIGVARAALLPAISLTGSAGFASTQLDSLFDPVSRAWALTPVLRLPLLDGGNVHQNLNAAQASQRLALAQYEKALQTALREAADVLADRQQWAMQLALQHSQLTALHKAAELAQARYEAGSESLLSVLDAQRSLYAAQHSLIGLQLAAQLNRVTLWKVLGGMP